MAESIVQVTEGTGKKLHTNSRTIGANTVEDEIVVQGIPYLATYTAAGVIVSNATALSHLMQVMAGATLNVYITRIRVYQIGLATAAAIGGIYIMRLTTAGTGGGVVTPTVHETGASGATAMTLPTVLGALGTTLHAASALFMQTLPTSGGGSEQVKLFDWSADQYKVQPIKIPAGVANGICVRNVTAIAAATCHVNVEFFEANF